MPGKTEICICGGGHIAHSLAALLPDDGETMHIYTRKPQLWESRLTYEKGAACVLHESKGVLSASNDKGIVGDCDCIFVALPRFAIEDVLTQIDPVLHDGQTLIFVPAPAGLEIIAERLSARGIDTLGFQRVPYVARTIDYGHSVWISEVRKEHKIAFSRRGIEDRWRNFFEARLGGQVVELSSFLSFTFSNSNPLLHPARLVELLKGGEGGVYDRCPLFYAEWTDVSSELYVKADEEMFAAFCAYAPKCAMSDYESVLKHYEASSIQGLSRKIRSIESLKNIQAPWTKIGDAWVPDCESRYFTEDIPFGTKVIRDYAKKKGIRTPTIDYIIENCCIQGHKLP